MSACPRCRRELAEDTSFCPHCGAQLRAQTVEGEVIPSPSGAGAVRLPNPVIAALLSIVPGLGHVYAGAPARGLLFFAAVITPEVIGTDLDLTVIGDVIGIPLNLGGLGIWVYSAVDAYHVAKRRGQSLS